MGDSSRSSGSVKSLEANNLVSGKREPKRSIVASRPKSFSENTIKSITTLTQSKIASGAVGDIALFLLKVAALETVRRFSKAKCPFAWRGLQALQIFCYPPFKWVQRWTPFKGLVKGLQMLSRPLFALSIATSFSDLTGCSSGTSDITNSPSSSDLHSELSSLHSSLDIGTPDEATQGLTSENWLIQLYRELENQGISLPERFSETELNRFYTAANGDFLCFLSSIKKTIRWRETYKILSDSELDVWSHLVFWHGFDLKKRPCLIVRLGLACISLPSHDRPRFVQAVISQVDYGVLHLVDEEDLQITVLVDCDGLSPFKIPMQMMRFCSSLLQDHFPNRLGCLFIIRLPPVVRVLAQTFMQVLKPVTRKKLRIVGDYKRVLYEYLQTLPSYLDGKCTCMKCSKVKVHGYVRRPPGANEMDMIELMSNGCQGEDLILPFQTNETDNDLNGNCDQVLRTAIISVLMLWVFIAVIAGMYNPEGRIFLPP